MQCKSDAIQIIGIIKKGASCNSWHLSRIIIECMDRRYYFFSSGLV